MCVPGRAWHRGQAGRELQRRGPGGCPSRRGSPGPRSARPRVQTPHGQPWSPPSGLGGTWSLARPRRAPAAAVQPPGWLLQWPGPGPAWDRQRAFTPALGGSGDTVALSAAASPQEEPLWLLPRPPELAPQLPAASSCCLLPLPPHACPWPLSARAAHAWLAGVPSLWPAQRDTAWPAAMLSHGGVPTQDGGAGELFTGTPPCGWGVVRVHIWAGLLGPFGDTQFPDTLGC